MIFHFSKIAFRNHLKHKVQSVISLLSLAIAFACVSLAGFWSHYEQTYDSFLPEYKNIYKVAFKQPGTATLDDQSRMPLPIYLMENYAEVDKACGVGVGWFGKSFVEINNHIFESRCTTITPETVEMFDVQWKEGQENLDSWNENDVAISEKIAREVCGKDSPVGLILNIKDEDGLKTIREYQIVAVFKTRPLHSNLKFNILKKLNPLSRDNKLCETYVQLNSKTDSKLFLQKLKADESLKKMNLYGCAFDVLTPLKEVHYTYPEKMRNVRLDDVKLFACAAVLLSVCALLNYLMLFVNRLRNRGRDMALRTVCGSSSWQTGMLLMVEYLLLLFGALFFSILFIELVYNGFVELAQLTIGRSTIYAGCGFLLLFIFALATVLSLIPILYFKRKTLRVQMDSVPVQSGTSRFRMVGVCVQLFISLLFIFCATIMIKQVHFLIHDDIHIERKNIASLMVGNMKGDQIIDILKQMPMITDVIPVNSPLFPYREVGSGDFDGFEGHEDLVIPARIFDMNSDIARFYGLRMKEGSNDFNLAMNEYFINETLAKQLGDPNPVGKTFYRGRAVIKGIIHDFAYQPPSEPVRAVFFRPTLLKNPNSVAFKYSGDFVACKTAIEKAFEEHLFYLKDGETVYKSYLTSELNLLKLLNIITAISVLIALFGVYALILQECERQRKNIAIRKVYGAQIKDILMMFFKEYMLQVALAAAFAFPIGYVLMKHWLQGYSRQTSIGIEVFLGIFVGMSLLVLLCIGWHVWRAANENPATAVKKE